MRGHLTNIAQVSHNLHVTEVYLGFLEREPAIAAAWASEDELGETRKKFEKQPDAVLYDRDGKPRLAVEFGGLYGVDKLQAFHTDMERRASPMNSGDGSSNDTSSRERTDDTLEKRKEDRWTTTSTLRWPSSTTCSASGSRPSRSLTTGISPGSPPTRPGRSLDAMVGQKLLRKIPLHGQTPATS